MRLTMGEFSILITVVFYILEFVIPGPPIHEVDKWVLNSWGGASNFSGTLGTSLWVHIHTIL